ncbi:hypothetical protein [Maridesulfovibrio frigidus]|uniref:hypothetical protein n=1 Tax=Maridesulfovibrio frigidus TaxID=340956 RepID=UPI0004E1D9B7|nr:hypothetical protein [Maridesulfovibrio frigidus]
MILPIMAKDIVTLKKVNGDAFEGIKAVVSAQRIITFEIDMVIDAKDLIVHTSDNGNAGTYIVLESNRMPICDGIDAHYHLTVRKLSAEEL